MTETVLAVVCVALAAALIGVLIQSARERHALMGQMAVERETLLRAALAKSGVEFVEMQRSADYGKVLVEQQRARFAAPAPDHEPGPHPPEGLG